MRSVTDEFARLLNYVVPDTCRRVLDASGLGQKGGGKENQSQGSIRGCASSSSPRYAFLRVLYVCR